MAVTNLQHFMPPVFSFWPISSRIDASLKRRAEPTRSCGCGGGYELVKRRVPVTNKGGYEIGKRRVLVTNKGGHELLLKKGTKYLKGGFELLKRRVRFTNK